MDPLSHDQWPIVPFHASADRFGHPVTGMEGIVYGHENNDGSAPGSPIGG